MYMYMGKVSNGNVRGVCNFLGSVSSQQKFEAMGQSYSFVLQLHFVQKVKENTSLICEGMPTQKMQREERPPACWLLFLYVFFSSPGPALCKLGQPGALFLLPEVLNLVLRSSFVLFLWAFPFFVFQPLPFWTPFSYSNYLTILQCLLGSIGFFCCCCLFVCLFVCFYCGPLLKSLLNLLQYFLYVLFFWP